MVPPAELLRVPARPALPDPDTMTDGDAGEAAFRLFAHVILLERQLERIGAWAEEAAAITRRRAVPPP
jgi:hypothetical protein